MREREPLLAAICDAPDDEFPRRVYADWLDDHGEPERAEFIRLQLRLAALGPDDPARPALARREEELLAANRDGWLTELPKWRGVEVSGPFRRGWPESANCTGEAFVRHGAKLARALPLRGLSFSKLTPGQCAKLAAVPALAGVRELSLSGHKVGDRGAIALFRSQHLAGLTSLNLYSSNLTAAAMEALAASPLKRLHTLEVSSNTLYDAGVAALAEAQGWDELRVFKGYGMGLSPEAADAFAGAPAFSRLETLELSQNWLGDAGVARLVRRTSATWRCLDLGHNEIGDDGAEALARSPRVAQLEELILGDNAIGPRGMRALAGSPHLARLRVLDTHVGNPFGDEGAFALARSPYLKNLIELDVNEAGFGPEAMEALAASPNVARLTKLHVGGCPIGPRGARAIAESPHLRRLQRLFLWDCQIGDDGCQALMRSPNVPNLTWLSLDDNGLTDAGVRAILDSPYLANLTEELDLEDEGISDGIVPCLRERFGNALWLYRPGVPGANG